MKNSWVAFWIFMSVFMVCDSYLFSKGYETFFWGHKTPEEKQIQQLIIERRFEDNCNE